MTGNAAIDSVLERVASVVAIVNAKADPADAGRLPAMAGRHQQRGHLGRPLR
jgi:hypothetical protein